MSLLVMGAPQALATAVLAAATSGERVLVLAEDTPAPLPAHAELDGTRTPISLSDSLDGEKVHACVIVAESGSLEHHIAAHRELLSGLPVLLAPGGLAGALRVTRWEGSLLAAEATGFPAAGAQVGDTFIVRGVKQDLPMAAADEMLTAPLLSEFSRYLPTLVASDLRTTSMANTNHLIHPPVTLLNAVRIDSATPFTLYREGISPTLDHLLEAVDEERRAICRAVGADDRRGRDWLHGFYGADGMQGDTLVDCLASYPGFETVAGPSTLDYRYLTDDVPFGAAQWAAIGRRLDIPTPWIDHLLAVLALIAPDLRLDADELTLELFLEHVQQHSPTPIPSP